MNKPETNSIFFPIVWNKAKHVQRKIFKNPPVEGKVETASEMTCARRGSRCACVRHEELGGSGFAGVLGWLLHSTGKFVPTLTCVRMSFKWNLWRCWEALLHTPGGGLTLHKLEKNKTDGVEREEERKQEKWVQKSVKHTKGDALEVTLRQRKCFENTLQIQTSNKIVKWRSKWTNICKYTSKDESWQEKHVF